MKVFYDPRMAVANNPSFSPSAGKPAKVVESWRRQFPVELMPVSPVTEAELALVHDPVYVDDILSCRLNNGFDNKLPEIAESLKWTNGSFVSAAVYAAIYQVSTVSPTSGFHHACYDKAMGFCTFNGLALAANILFNGMSCRVAIADIDAHYGNGTDDIIQKLGIDYIKHYTYGKRPLVGKLLTDSFGPLLRGMIRELVKDVDILFYQAGADPHVDDPYGGYLTTEQLMLRDRIVFEEAEQAGIPVVWNLAGGYQTPIEKVLEIHDNTARMHLDILS